MCDCYYHPCKACGLPLPVHLRDFDTGRDEIEVYCRKHIPRGDPDVRAWDIIGRRLQRDLHTTRIGIKALTDNARHSWDGNAPNLDDTRCREV
jgi:hypothetical protein